jgi:hypothetical protein
MILVKEESKKISTILLLFNHTYVFMCGFINDIVTQGK